MVRPKTRWPARWNAPKSLCGCGHSGDGPDSDHRDDYGPDVSPGHGRCLVKGCGCTKFSWLTWTPAFKAAAGMR